MALAPIPILMYHSIANDPPTDFARWTVTPSRFRSHLDALVAAGHQMLTVSGAAAAVERSKLPPRPLVLTVDDGFADFRRHAVPELRRRGLPATLYVTTGYLGGTSRWLGEGGAGSIRMLEESDLAGIPADEIEIGAHGHSHAMLDLLPDHMLEKEVAIPRRMLREITGQPVASYAYPHGYSNRSVRARIREAGFTTAVSVHHSVSAGMSERFEIPRVIVEGTTDADRLLEMVAGRGVRSKRLRRTQEQVWRLRRQAWRGRQRRLAASCTKVEA